MFDHARKAAVNSAYSPLLLMMLDGIGVHSTVENVLVKITVKLLVVVHVIVA